jgi:hypothetical protein
MSSQNKHTPNKSERRLQFNDTIEVYYYPENKEQHEHHLTVEYEENDIEQLECDEPPVGSNTSAEADVE